MSGRTSFSTIELHGKEERLYSFTSGRKVVRLPSVVVQVLVVSLNSYNSTESFINVWNFIFKMDIVFFDKDSTLGKFHDGASGLYPNVDNFLDSQRKLGRKLYVATTAGEGGRQHLVNVADKLDGYFGSEQINVSIRQAFYFLPDGTIRNILDDYMRRKEFESPQRQKELDDGSYERGDRLFALPYGSEEREQLQKVINDFFAHWGQYLHKETREPLDDSIVYQNPHLNGGAHSKDLHLARRLIVPIGYEQLRTVMVGDYGDRTTVSSDPETPLIIISNDVRKGNWQMVSVMLDRMFSNGSMPWQVYEEMFKGSTPREDEKYHSFSLNGIEFLLEKGDHSERRVYCP